MKIKSGIFLLYFCRLVKLMTIESFKPYKCKPGVLWQIVVDFVFVHMLSPNNPSRTDMVILPANSRTKTELQFIESSVMLS